jgi:hypothetical protein
MGAWRDGIGKWLVMNGLSIASCKMRIGSCKIDGLAQVVSTELHLLDAGHRALETHLTEIVGLVRDSLERMHP